MESQRKFLDWSPAKKDELKFRLWKEFGLSRYLDVWNEEFHPKRLVSDSEYEYLLEIVKVREHFNVTLSHKNFVVKSFLRFQEYFESKGVTKEQVNRHDDSKLTNFLEIIGYTYRWILNIKTTEWDQVWTHHYTHNPHHPEYFSSDENGEKTQKDMEYVYLVESVIDMIACEWELKMCGKEDATDKDLLTFEDKYLERYTPNDRIRVNEIVDQLLKRYRNIDHIYL